MIKKYITILIVSLMFSLVFVGVGDNETEYRQAAELFKTGLLDGLRAIVMGLLLGAILQFKPIESHIKKLPMASLLYGPNLLYISLLPILIGVFGAAIVFYQFKEVGLLGPPLHASCIGLSFLVIFGVLRWSRANSI